MWPQMSHSPVTHIHRWSFTWTSASLVALSEGELALETKIPNLGPRLTSLPPPTLGPGPGPDPGSCLPCPPPDPTEHVQFWVGSPSTTEGWVREGDSVQLLCQGDGSPSLEYTFFRLQVTHPVVPLEPVASDLRSH